MVGNVVIQLDLVGKALKSTYSVDMPQGLALSADGRWLYVGTFRGADYAGTEYDLLLFDTHSGALSRGLKLLHPDPNHAGSDIKGLALTPDGGTLYAPSVDGDGVFVVSAAALDAVGFIPMQAFCDFGPYRAVISPDGARLYVVSEKREPATLIVLDASSLQVIAEIVAPADGPCAQQSRGVDISPDGNTLYMVTSGGCALVIDADRQAIVDSFMVSYSALESIAIHPDGDRAYVLDWPGRVYVVDLATRTVQKTLSAIDGGHVIKLSPDGKRGYVSGRVGFSVLDLATDSVLKSVDLGRGSPFDIPSSLGVWPDSTQYVAGTMFNLYVYDAETDSEIRNFDLSDWGQPWLSLVEDIVFSSDGGTGYLAMPDEKAITLFNAHTWQLIAPIDIGRMPYLGVEPVWLVLNPDGHTLYVLINSTDKVLALDTTTNRVIKTVRVGRPYRSYLPLIR